MPIGYTSSANPSARLRGMTRATPYGGNSLADHNPELLGEWADERNPHAVTFGSGYQAQWRCAHGHEWKAAVKNRTKTARPAGCPICSGRVPAPDTSLAALRPDLAAEWADPDKRAEDVRPGADYYALWRCGAGHEWRAYVYSRSSSNGRGCPVCANRKVEPGVNDLATLRPDLAAEWRGSLDASCIVPGSHVAGEWECSRCQHHWTAEVRSRALLGSGCPQCASRRFASRMEDEIVEFLGDTIVIERHRRDLIPGELDIYLPEHLIAIEVNGVYWHSEAGGKDSRYHLNKLEECRKKGIKLIQVWEDDWNDRAEVIKRMLAHKLGLSMQPTIAARETSAEFITSTEAQTFLAQHHIQGGIAGTHYLGLRAKDGRLVAVTVLKRTSNQAEIRLERYATSQRVPGGHSKLVRFAEQNIPSWECMFTFADAEVSEGGLYRRTGWVEDKTIPPDYKYLVRGRRVHKFNYRLKRFRNDPELTYVEGMSERELARLNKLPRVWDSGKVRYRYTRSMPAQAAL